jgi:hypothetical protein
MKKTNVIFLLILVFMVMAVVSAVDLYDWKQITVDNSVVNNSSDVSFTVMMPPGNTNKTVDTPVGPITNFVNKTDSSVITIVIIPNPLGKQLNNDNYKDCIDNLMKSLNVTPIEGQEPKFLEDGSMVDYVMRGNETIGVYVLSTDEKISIVSGFRRSLDDAVAGTENLGKIAGTIQIQGNLTDWKQIKVDTSAVNSSSDVRFTVMMPPGNMNKTVDTPMGPITNFVNMTDSSVITIVIIPNPLGKQLNKDNYLDCIDNLMKSLNVTPIEGQEPKFLKDGSIVDYVMRGNVTVGVSVRSTDEKISIASGFRRSLDDAVAGIENLGKITGTIRISTPEQEK